MAERALEPAEILRRTRIAIMPYVREIGRHGRALIPRMERTQHWIKYYEDLSKVRPLTKREEAAVERHRKNLRVFRARRKLYSTMARYARTKKPTDLVAMRLSQADYYEAKADTLPPEKAEEMREAIVPPEELYDEWEKVREDIEAQCKMYIQAKYRLVPITPVQRYIRMKSLGESLRDAHVRAFDLAEKGKTLPAIVREYAELKRIGRIT